MSGDVVFEAVLDDGGALRLRSISDDVARPEVVSEYGEWGEIDPAAKSLSLDRWLIEVQDEGEGWAAVGDMSAHPQWYGASPGSRAMNIGIGLVAEARGRGIGWRAQAGLAAHLHASGVVRVEASTDVTNAAEQRALSRAGFVYEGTLRGAQVRADGRHDLQVWSHLVARAD